MNPRELLLHRIEEHVAPGLEPLGFAFSRSRIRFTRTAGIARQEISFSLSKYNSEDFCQFWTMWGATAREYSRWHRATFGEVPANSALGGSADWNIPGWSTSVTGRRQLQNTPEDLAVARSLLRDVIEAGIPFLDSISNWSGAASQFLEDGLFFTKAGDCYLIAGEADAAREAWVHGIRVLAAPGKQDQLGELPGLRERLGRFFPDDLDEVC